FFFGLLLDVGGRSDQRATNRSYVSRAHQSAFRKPSSDLHSITNTAAGYFEGRVYTNSSNEYRPSYGIEQRIYYVKSLSTWDVASRDVIFMWFIHERET